MPIRDVVLAGSPAESAEHTLVPEGILCRIVETGFPREISDRDVYGTVMFSDTVSSIVVSRYYTRKS